VDGPMLEYRSLASAPRPKRRTLAHAALVLVMVADCLAGFGYSAAAAGGRIGASELILIVGAALGFLAAAAWLTAVAFAFISLADRDGPRRLAWLALSLAAASVSGTFLLGRLLERSRV
jgi:hypothetical protein